MKRAIALVLVACAFAFGVILATRGAAGPSLQVTPQPRGTACGSSHCGVYAATLHWTGIPSTQSTTGYNVFLNGTQVGTSTGRSYTFSAIPCGTTFQLGVQAHDSGSYRSRRYTTSYTSPSCGRNTPVMTRVPALVDSTLLNNYEAADVVQASVGSWNNCSGGPACTYTYQFQHCTGISGTTGTGCTNIGSAPQCSATTATTCSYTLASGDVGDYVVSSVMATNSGGTSAPAASKAAGAVVASRLNHFCNVSAAYSNLTTGPHLCGWPDSTNTGYQNAPGYPGSLTVASSNSSTCPTTPQSNHTYSFCKYNGLSLPTNLTNVTFYGDDFQHTAPQNPNVTGGSGDNNITFNYDTFQPSAVSSPPASCSQSYQYGIYNENGAMKGYTVEHSDFWGFGNAIDTAGSTQTTPQTFQYNWIHDSVTTGGCGYHNDGIGMLNPNTESYATVDHNTIEFLGNTNLIAWQNGTYSHIQNTNNLLSGDNVMYAGGRCTSSCTPPTNITTTGNTLNTYLAFSPPGGGAPLDAATNFWSGPGDVWNHNYWAVPPEQRGEPPRTTATTGSPPSTAKPHKTVASSAKPTTQTPTPPATEVRRPLFQMGWLVGSEVPGPLHR